MYNVSLLKEKLEISRLPRRCRFLLHSGVNLIARKIGLREIGRGDVSRVDDSRSYVSEEIKEASMESIDRAFKTVLDIRWNVGGGEGEGRETGWRLEIRITMILAKSIVRSLEFSVSLITWTFIYIRSFTSSLFLFLSLSRVSYKLCTLLARVHGLLILTFLPPRVFSRPLYLNISLFLLRNEARYMHRDIRSTSCPLSFFFRY